MGRKRWAVQKSFWGHDFVWVEGGGRKIPIQTGPAHSPVRTNKGDLVESTSIPAAPTGHGPVEAGQTPRPPLGPVVRPSPTGAPTGSPLATQAACPGRRTGPGARLRGPGARGSLAPGTPPAVDGRTALRVVQFASNPVPRTSARCAGLALPINRRAGARGHRVGGSAGGGPDGGGPDIYIHTPTTQ